MNSVLVQIKGLEYNFAKQKSIYCILQNQNLWLFMGKIFFPDEAKHKALELSNFVSIFRYEYK